MIKRQPVNRGAHVFHSALWLVFLFLVLAVGQAEAFQSRHLLTIGKDSGTELRHPSDVLIDDQGRVFVLDGVNNRVAVFDRAGKFLYDFGRGGSEAGELDNPLGMAMDSVGNIYIADTGNARVQRFSSRGDYIGHIDLPMKKGYPRPDATDVAVDDTRALLYIVDNDSHQVLVYDLRKDRFRRPMGGMGMKGGEFRYPFSIYLDQKGTIYVVDVINTAVKSFLPDEKRRFDASIGKWGVEKGELFRPKGVAVDAMNRVFVSDSFLGALQVFDTQGRFLAPLNDEQGKVRKFVTPTRLRFDDKGRLYVVEMFAHRVTVFEIGK